MNGGTDDFLFLQTGRGCACQGYNTKLTTCYISFWRLIDQTTDMTHVFLLTNGRQGWTGILRFFISFLLWLYFTMPWRETSNVHSPALTAIRTSAVSNLDGGTERQTSRILAFELQSGWIPSAMSQSQATKLNLSRLITQWSRRTLPSPWSLHFILLVVIIVLPANGRWFDGLVRVVNWAPD